MSGIRSSIQMFILMVLLGVVGVAWGAGPMSGLVDIDPVRKDIFKGVPRGLGDSRPDLEIRVLNIEDFGAVAGGVIDAREAIQMAIDEASLRGGMKVFVPAGLYRVGGEILMRSGVTIEGVGDESVLYADGDWNLFFFLGTWWSSIENTAIRKLHLRGPGVPSAGFSTLIAMREYVENSLIEDCLLTDSGYDAWYALHEVSGVRVINNRILNCLDDGLNPGGRADGEGTHDILIKGNTITGSGHDGIHLSDGSYGITVVGNTIYNSEAGIGFFRSNFNVISGNTIIGCGTGIRTRAGRPTGIEISNNIIMNSESHGIDFTGNRVMVVGNVVTDSGGNGIFLNERGGRNLDVVVQSNVVERSSHNGIRTELECGVVADNIVRDSSGVAIYDANRYSRMVRNDVDGGIFNFQGDTNCDQSIDGMDLEVILKMWGVCDLPVGSICHADVNGDGVVDVNDINIVQQNFGQ